MSNLTQMQFSATTFFQAYASFAAFMMMARSMFNELIPYEFRSYIVSFFEKLFGSVSKSLKELTLVIDEKTGMTSNEIYAAAELYLGNKVSPSNDRICIAKSQQQKNYSVTIEKGEEVLDKYENIQLKWKFICDSQEKKRDDRRYFELSFNKKFMDEVLNSYLPYVEQKAKEIKEDMKVVKLYSQDCPYHDDYSGGGGWGSIHLDHPSTFETLALDPEIKDMIIDDLDRFLQRRDFYRKVGKAWKRGYLLYGPPGTGKSSLIAAMANYLKFDIFDLELTSIYNNSDFRRTMLSISNRSIVVIEDIDCHAVVHDREDSDGPESKLTLSGILNVIDGFWSSIGDEKIIVFTTNHKDKLDPALLRPGRMDVHINLSYCTVYGFRHLAYRYHAIDGSHPLCSEIEEMIQCTNVTPAEVAEEFMRSDNADFCLEGLVKLLKSKKMEAEEQAEKEKEGDSEVSEETGSNLDTNGDVDDRKKSGKYRMRKGKKCITKMKSKQLVKEEED